MTDTKQTTGREALSEDQKKQLDAIRELHRHSHDPADAEKLRTIDKFERQAGMTAVQRMEDDGKEDYAYKGSKLNQLFTTIRRITTHKGYILIDVDEAEAERQARVKAFHVLGPLAPEEDIFKYVADNSNKTTLLTINRFMRNLKILVTMVQQHPERFGLGTGGSAVRDVLDEAFGAIKEARAYLKAHRHEMPEWLYNFLRGGDMQTTDKRKFIEHLGKDWDRVVAATHNVTDATRLFIKDQKH